MKSGSRSFGTLWMDARALRRARLGFVHPLAVAIAVVAALMCVTAASARSRAGAARTATLRDTLGTARTIVFMVNVERQQRGLKPLSVNTRLEADARLQARQIAASGVFAHVIPGEPYPTPDARARAAGYRWNMLGENLAFGFPDAASAVRAWMSSPGHRANILAGDYTETGVVLATDPEGNLIFVQTFGTPE